MIAQKRLATLSVLLLSALAFAQHAPQRMGSEPLDPEREARAQRLGKNLRCAVCQGLSVTDSPASMARAQLDKVRELVVEGKSDTEINEYFVARYGEWVLLEPTTHGINWFVWLSPAILLAVGFLIILGQVRRRGTVAPPPAGAPEAQPSPSPDDAYLTAVRAELDK